MQDVLYLLCQTITVGLIVWSLVAQMVSGSKLSKTLAVYEQRISLVSINKTKVLDS